VPPHATSSSSGVCQMETTPRSSGGSVASMPGGRSRHHQPASLPPPPARCQGRETATWLGGERSLLQHRRGEGRGHREMSGTSSSQDVRQVTRPRRRPIRQVPGAMTTCGSTSPVDPDRPRRGPFGASQRWGRHSRSRYEGRSRRGLGLVVPGRELTSRPIAERSEPDPRGLPWNVSIYATARRSFTGSSGASTRSFNSPCSRPSQGPSVAGEPSSRVVILTLHMSISIDNM
jgi:hypothetical protein